ncbi:MAG: helix-turn-helix domain-containing protein [Streptococcus sp.]|nr:helix-turn-helix domain-containing protein [Streptococcus sp.]
MSMIAKTLLLNPYPITYDIQDPRKVSWIADVQNKAAAIIDSVFEETSQVVETEWLDTEQAAAYLQISPGSLRNMVSDGRIPHYKLQRRNRYLKSELDKLIMQNKRGSHGY